MVPFETRFKMDQCGGGEAASTRTKRKGPTGLGCLVIILGLAAVSVAGQAVGLIPKPTQEPTPRTIQLSGQAQPDYQPQDERLTLARGTYSLSWSATGPFQSDEFGAVCAINISLFDSAGNRAGGVTKTLETPSSGTLILSDLAAGEYDLFIYIGCPWSIQIIGP